MKRGFTLVELLIVIVVITILMTVTFKVMSVGEEAKQRNLTIVRLQALENCVGGYFAAFGSYPPVPLHASRDYKLPLNCMFLQKEDAAEGNGLTWKWVEAACRAQPMAMCYPCRRSAWAAAEKAGAQIANQVAKGDGRIGNKELLSTAFGGKVETTNLKSKESDFASGQDGDTVRRPEWQSVQCFKFGLMSFLLPRYLMMMNGPDNNVYDELDQWGNNNSIPCRFDTGVPYNSWADLALDVKSPQADGDGSAEAISHNYWRVALMPSQIVTSRWLANLQGMLAVADPEQGTAKGTHYDLYGINIASGDFCGANLARAQTTGDNVKDMWVYSSGSGDAVTQTYVLDGVTCMDGYGNEFFYYSPPPYQGYRLWSAGKNGKTFPPWVSDGEIDSLGVDNAKTARQWKKDDIVHMNTDEKDS